MLYFIYNVFSIVFFLLLYFIIVVLEISVQLVYLELLLFLFYFINFIWNILNFNRYPLFLLVYFVFGLFIYSRFILELFGLLPYPVNLATRFIGNFFERSTIQETVLIYILSIISLAFSYSCICFFSKEEKFNNDYFSFKKLGYYIILLSFPGVIFKIFITLKNVMCSGYLSLYLDNSVSGVERVIEFFSYKLYLIGVSFYISSNLSKKEFIKLSIFTLPIALAYLLSGKRGDLGVNILFLMWYWFSFIRIYNISLKKLFFVGFLIGIPFALVSQVINNSRANGNNEEVGLVTTLSDFFAQQGVSGIVLPYYIEHKNNLSKEHPYLISPIIDRMNRGGQSSEILERTNYLGYELTAVLDYEAFLRGEGVGTTYITELYSIGDSKISVFLGMFLLGIAVLYFEINKNKPIFKYLSYLILSTILFLPRGELFELFYEFILLVVIWHIAKLFVNSKINKC
ncbi:O-antigen polysaccharide polymerase Wzy [Rodentibacter pneumotropicus]|uniref:O-antigen polysaccharide polymerase Wzy n=1 Tax=Rodentibacter pneumotropicus TaxID=758 RepID=UPI0023306140|nr:O-antigen polysaccharide polymerase Wzy [Rodentibacter pneumotropicus]MDC2825185.1 O-antigen polysaccharide polymerase Wzy [Rodentibacter pneumotropicus]